MTRNSAFTLQVVGGDSELVFTGAMLSLASIFSESVIFCCLVGMIIYMNPTLALIIFVIGLLISILILKGFTTKVFFWGQKLQETGIKNWSKLIAIFSCIQRNYSTWEKRKICRILSFIQNIDQRYKPLKHLQTLTKNGIRNFFVIVFVLTISYLCIKMKAQLK